ncbi:MAG: DNA-3-methyladenine glycosylase I [Planctomycetota bacterium]|nr:DNA-3-methyladenine glycosylase I [Planctomycetota bacterium]
MPRCPWAKTPLSIAYHDEEWGVPVRDDRTLFEFLILEGAQAGLSWETILAKRARYREVYAGFDPQAVARFTSRDQARLLGDPGIVRNRLKVAASIANARAFLRVAEERGSFAAYAWSFVEGAEPPPAPRVHTDIPPRSPVSDVFSKDLKRRGFSFVGTTIMYAFMQAVGMVNDHLADCPRRDAVQRRA